MRNPIAAIPVRNANSFKNPLAPASAKCEIYGENPEPWSARIAKSGEKRLAGPPREKAKCEMFIRRGEYCGGALSRAFRPSGP